MKIDILTLFPEMFGSLNESIVRRAQDKGLVEINIHDLRKWANDKHNKVDDTPYGGGAGMVLKADVIYRALCDIASIDKDWSQKISNLPNCLISNKKSAGRGRSLRSSEAAGKGATSAEAVKPWIILPTPRGETFDQVKARSLSERDHLVFVCAHYEGYDERIIEMINEEVSLGDFVLTGGEIPAMAITDSVARLLPGAISAESLSEESFSAGGGRSLRSSEAAGKGATSAETFTAESFSESLKHEALNSKKNLRLSASNSATFRDLEYPQYTRPEEIDVEIGGKKKKLSVPDVLLSGNHQKIKEWREGNRK